MSPRRLVIIVYWIGHVTFLQLAAKHSEVIDARPVTLWSKCRHSNTGQQYKVSCSLGKICLCIRFMYVFGLIFGGFFCGLDLKRQLRTTMEENFSMWTIDLKWFGNVPCTFEQFSSLFSDSISNRLVQFLSLFRDTTVAQVIQDAFRNAQRSRASPEEARHAASEAVLGSIVITQ